MVKVYMRLDKDGLPTAIADSIEELAEITGERACNIRSSISHQKKRKEPLHAKHRPKKWDVVEIDEEEE